MFFFGSFFGRVVSVSSLPAVAVAVDLPPMFCTN